MIMWRDSKLAAKISDTLGKDLDQIWTKAEKFYNHTNPPGWVSHGSDHIRQVLKILGDLIPQDVLDKIDEIEAFILIAGTLLHDIGMVLPEGAATDAKLLAGIREQHGKRGANMVGENFADFLNCQPGVYMAVCEVVKNHQGVFQPQQVTGVRFNVRADALWVRLADELDFGKKRAPSFLMEYVQPESQQYKHWCKHNQLNEPTIDIDLLRVQISGKVQDHLVVRKLRDEFENSNSQDLQQLFLGRGRQGKSPRSFLIWDCTTLVTVPGNEYNKSIDPRPARFEHEQYLIGARFFYNLGRYQEALKCFEQGKEAYQDKIWTEEPLVYYFYHYIKTLGGLGQYEKMLELTEASDGLSKEVLAAIKVSRGLAYWKLGDCHAAKSTLETSVEIYQSLSRDDPRQRVNEADAHSMIAIVLTESIRDTLRRGVISGILGRPDAIKWDSGTNGLFTRAIQELVKADRLFTEFEEYSREVGKQDGTHYRGRYWGAKAFLELLDIDRTKKYSPEAWKIALDAARLSHMGMRNPFGAMCGKYCEAVVCFHKYFYCAEQEALRDAARMLQEVHSSYEALFDRLKAPVPRLWHKMMYLLKEVHRAIPRGNKVKQDLSKIARRHSVSPIELLTPLH